MSINVAIEHRTAYHFDRAVTIHPHVLRLRPAPHCRTPILAYSLTIEPREHFVNWQQDPFGNHLARLVFPEPARSLEVVVDLVADLTVVNPFDFFVEETAERYPFVYEPLLHADLEPYFREVEGVGPRFEEWLAEWRRKLPAGVATDGIAIVEFLVSLNQSLSREVAYSVRMEPGVQPPEQTLERQIGSCRDTGWLLVAVLRRLGLAARFVSGYLVQLRSDIRALDGPDGPVADFTDLHAWAEVFIPGAGWVGLDPTSGLFAGEGHIPLACTPHPVSAAPITGTTGPCEVTFEFANIVHRVREDPRVTLPYTEDQWERIDRLGRRVDDQLAAGDVRLTMGGEPTFVSIDDMEGAEWNNAADSPAKRSLAQELAVRLAGRFGSGSLLHHSQGKWYPGEPLPRWQIAIQWRHDGEPMWADPKLLAQPEVPGEADAGRVELLIRAIARRFAIDQSFVLAAYEDPIDALWRQARLPGGEPPEIDVDAAEPDLGTVAGRDALFARLDATMGSVTGWVLPLHTTATGWGTARWHLRRGRLTLLPGDSPVGLRLPLDSLTWSPNPAVHERSPYEPRDELAVHGTGPTAPAEVVPVETAPPTALAVELRNGNAHVFLPPIEHLEQAIELLSVVEQSAGEIGLPIVIEGYAPPRDPRTSTLVVTPDPGVIEVNVHPAGSWPELVSIIETVHAEARLNRLGTEKFSLDGSHTGTGGGNHITLGGASPADSPLLRRPDLLRSLITFWQHHPSLSYLFSGRFVGPTSQAPRVDEGRDENLYELEIAFAELERAGDDAPPWLVDRLLRHLLVDITGNTHRAEFCIDKLFSPDSERGRLGLLELRGFEMPPHPRMALVQALLIRSLVARFWTTPYTGRLVRWGTDLHDRFLLPWYTRVDIHDVVDDLALHGISFDPVWLEPFLEFRFPLIGEVTVADVRLELRSAIEPWHVLGEETTLTGTARYVDSSVERLQVLAEGFNEARHVVTCNGVPIPLQPTAVPAIGVGGVRYKAWKPWSALHPTIDVHTPLVFDLVDLWSDRSLGGCTYHVAHPGGRNYDTFPVNASEAEARRAARFFKHGHTPGKVSAGPMHVSSREQAGEYPRTLDLRRHPPSG